MKKYVSWFFIIVIIIGFSLYIYIEEKDNTKKIDYCENKELFCEYYEDAVKYISNMTLDEKIGQLFIVRYDDMLFEMELNTYYPGGYIFYSGDFRLDDKDEFIKKIDYLQSKSKTPLALGVDEEGGTVKRISWWEEFASEEYKSPKEYLNKSNMDLVMEKEKLKLSDLKDIKLNYNFAPVLDIANNKKSYMWYRSISKDVNTVSEFAVKFTNLYNENNFTSTAKHFPGHGDNGDTHFLYIIDTRSLEEIKKDIEPFKAAIDAGIPWIQMAHITYEALDPVYPATISETIHDYLRNELGFSGLIVTDDMEMVSLGNFSSHDKLILSIKCGNNFMMTSNISIYFDILKKAYNNGDITDKDLDNILIKNIAWKYKYGLMK